MRTISSFLFVLAIGLFGSSSLAAAQSPPPAAGAKTVGSEKCARMCHKVQYDSWKTTKHALAKGGAECETCHGPGSGYVTISVMKDAAKSKAAGLIAKPDKATCATCHKQPVADDAPAKVHAHKKKV